MTIRSEADDHPGFYQELFCGVDDAMSDQQKQSQALLYPNETATLGLLFALKGVGNRAFYRWAQANLRPLFPRLPERTRLFRLLLIRLLLFRLLAADHNWTRRFLAQPSLLGVVDSFGIELTHPRREGRSPTDRQEGQVQPARDRRCQAVLSPEPPGARGGLGRGHGQRL